MTHLLKLLDKMCKYEKDPASIRSGHDSVHRQTDGWTDKVKPVYPPFNFVEGGYNNVQWNLYYQTRGLFHKWISASKSNWVETSPCCNSVNGHQIATNFCSCTKFFSHHCIRTDVRVKWNYHRIWIAMEERFVKRGPGKSHKFHHFPGSVLPQILFVLPVIRDCLPWETTYRKISNISRTKSQNLNESRLVLHLSLPNLLKPCVK